MTFEKWLLPASKLLIAESYFKLNSFDNAGLYLRQAEESNEYEYAELFESKIMNLKRKAVASKK
ncbi:MAG: hypothetical protein F9K45_08505 [Melioribacteraceae bacterium]|nr:MAG: hypothetical protein F9K45_08505 [Melioribacteraceae bacterium]